MRQSWILHIAFQMFFGFNACAMEFSIMPLGPQHYGGAVFEKFNAVLAVGPIEKGDAEKFEKVIPLAGRDMFGNIALVINSPGGSVEEAFKIVEIMDREEVSVYVPGTCASACRSIIYLSGRFHIVLDKGSIGFHPCFAQKGAALDPVHFVTKGLQKTRPIMELTTDPFKDLWSRR